MGMIVGRACTDAFKFGTPIPISARLKSFLNFRSFELDKAVVGINDDRGPILVVPVPAHGADYLLRRLVDPAVCSKCGGVEISWTFDCRRRAAFSYPNHGESRRE
jgi:hypothetical protein